VTTSEPRFTELDRGELLALATYRDGLCPLCGRPVEVCTSEEGVGPDFVVQQSTCRATVAIVERQRASTDGGKKPPHPYAPAFLWAATTRE
jgi:hypothetical protein